MPFQEKVVLCEIKERRNLRNLMYISGIPYVF